MNNDTKIKNIKVLPNNEELKATEVDNAMARCFALALMGAQAADRGESELSRTIFADIGKTLEKHKSSRKAEEYYRQLTGSHE